ncbi:hypothetical protein [Halorussus ruber]|uniref:hypothetical protein n=1 Tax=Halorussus ruber TaxID=1126238 RepID=UPI001091A61C
MTANLDNRVEAVAPIEDYRLQERFNWILSTLLSDNCKRWVMHSEATSRFPRGRRGPERTRGVHGRSRGGGAIAGWAFAVAPDSLSAKI